MKYSNAKKNGRKMKENMFTSGKAQIIFKYFCFILLMLITMLNSPYANAQGVSKETCKEACKEALSVIQPMNPENLEVHIKDIVNVVDTEGELCGLSLGYEVGKKPYGYAIYDIDKNNIKEFVFCDGIGNMYEKLEEEAEDDKNVDEKKLLNGIVYEGGIDYCTYDVEGNKVNLCEELPSNGVRNSNEYDTEKEDEIFETVNKSQYMKPCSFYTDSGSNMCSNLNYWDVADSNTSWHVVPDCGLAMISQQYVSSYYKRDYACTCVSATGILNWMGRRNRNIINTYDELYNYLDNRGEVYHDPSKDSSGNIIYDENGNIEYKSHGILLGSMAGALNHYFQSLNCKTKANALDYYGPGSSLQYTQLENHVSSTDSGEAAPCMMSIYVDDNNPKTSDFYHTVTVLSTLHNASDKYVGIWNGWFFDIYDKKDYVYDDITNEGLLKNVDTLASAYKAIRYISWSDLTKTNVYINAVLFKDVQSSNIKEIHTNYISAKTIDMTCVVPNGTKYIYYPTWDANEENPTAVWHQGTVEAGNYAKVSIDLSSYNSNKATTLYATHIYARDIYGNNLAVYGTVYSTTNNMITNMKTSSNYEGYSVSCTLPTGTSLVKFEVYPGSNELTKYYTGQISGNTANATIKYADYNYASGTYYTIAHAYDKYGKELATKQVTHSVAAKKITNVTISNIAIHGYKVTCTVPLGTAYVEFPTWTDKNGMDDVCLYKSKPDSNRTVSVWVNAMNHNYEGGKYTTQIKAYDKNGVLITTRNISTSIVDRKKISSVVINKGTNGEYYLNVMLPTGTAEVRYTIHALNAGRYGVREYYHDVNNKDGNDVLTVYKSNFYNVNGTYTNTITAYDASGDFIDSYDISTVLE